MSAVRIDFSQIPDLTVTGWPSTTEVIKSFGLYGDISRWSELAARNRDESDFCVDPMQRGRCVDGACNLLAQGHSLDPNWTDRHETCCLPYVEGYGKFLEEHDVRLVQCAYMVRNNLERYYGHPDQRVILDGRPALLDLKSGGMPVLTNLQTASYLKAEMAMQPANRELVKTVRVGLQLKEDDYKLHYFDDPRVGDEFILLARAWWIRAKYQKEVQ